MGYRLRIDIQMISYGVASVRLFTYLHLITLASHWNSKATWCMSWANMLPLGGQHWYMVTSNVPHLQMWLDLWSVLYRNRPVASINQCWDVSRNYGLRRAPRLEKDEKNTFDPFWPFRIRSLPCLAAKTFPIVCWGLDRSCLLNQTIGKSWRSQDVFWGGQNLSENHRVWPFLSDFAIH